ncbi:TPA: hypothetical protein REW47_002401, partial [Staphylococcus pseudintermedius]|nr:hypothetical protein [Staphylococcus pseudintermedius]HDU1464134.1 hypothetical protein [Staphylococcus pseudintermedius]
MKVKRLIFSIIAIFFYTLIGVTVMKQEISSTELELDSNVKLIMSFVLFIFLILGYGLPKFLYFSIIKAVFKIEELKLVYLLYVLILGFFPIYLSLSVNYLFGYSFEHIKNKYFDSALTSVLNPIEIITLLIIVYFLKDKVKFSMRDSIFLILGYIVVFTLINL